MSKVFIDTNILIYALDRHNLKKQKKCRSLLMSFRNKTGGVISTQIIQEFYVIATTKLKVDPVTVKNIIKSFDNFELIVVSFSLIHEAIDCGVLNKISFWDALIIVSAASAKCGILWTEDLNPGQTINGVKVENPL